MTLELKYTLRGSDSPVLFFVHIWLISLKLNKNNVTLEVDGRKNSRKIGELLLFLKSDECRIREREKRDRKVKRKKESKGLG